MHTPTKRRFGSKASEKGYILAMSALLLVPLLAFTGFATDVGAWYARASRMQRAADAAALAGVVWQPNFSVATTNARNTAERNGFVDGEDGIEINYYNTGPRQLRVEIVDTQVEVYFTSIFFDEVDITRDATAEYLQSLPMGSPDNHMGNDPINPPSGGNPLLWSVIGGPDTDKIQGERFQSGSCERTSAVGNSITAGCTNNADIGGNADYNPSGYSYVVNVTSLGSGPLRIQAYDPGHIVTGQTCNNSFPNFTSTQRNNLIAISESSGSFQDNGMNDANTRFANGATAFCNGDTMFSSTLSDTNGERRLPPLDTTYIVRGPDDTQFDNSDNPVIGGCARTFTGRANPSSATDPTSANIPTLELYQRLHPSDGNYDTNTVANWGREGVRMYTHFRQWFTLCQIDTPEVGRYVVQVRTNASQANSPASLVDADPNINSGGQNRFALRAGFGATGVPNGSGVGLYADGRLPVYVNTTAGTTSFFLARITPAYAGEVILLNFFDIGDAQGGSNPSVTFSVRPPAEARTGGATGPVLSSFTGCIVTRDGPAYTPTPQANCGVQDMTTDNYQGRMTSVQVPIPSTYWCNEADAQTGCWVKVNLTFSTGAVPTDTTTWSAAVLGDPVRLAE
jgi:hypothetical protein